VAERRPGLKLIAFAMICVVCAGWLAQQTGNVRFFASTQTYEAVLDNVSGLVAQDSVLLSGVRVGEVDSINIERGKALVTFTVDEDVTVRDTWEVGARWRNVTGQRYFYLYPIGDGEPLEPGARIPLEQSRPVADIGLFLERLTPLLRAINPEQQNRLVEALNIALDGKEARTQQLISELGSLSNTLADQDDKIDRVLTQGDALLSSYAQRKEDISGFLTDFASVSTTLAARDEQFLSALNDVSDVQEELASLIERNDSEIAGMVSELEIITGSVSDNKDDFGKALRTLRDGLAVYMLISRWGQWFNVRLVAVTVQNKGDVIYCTTEAGNPCPGETNEATPGGAQQTSARDTQQDRLYSRVPSRLDAATAVFGSAIGNRPGAGIIYARDQRLSAAATSGGGTR
jgi:phospholipid/cholesterol/gamma-HCH transport system substrate-binding protein